jgi:hypothetical protein
MKLVFETVLTGCVVFVLKIENAKEKCPLLDADDKTSPERHDSKRSTNETTKSQT